MICNTSGSLWSAHTHDTNWLYISKVRCTATVALANGLQFSFKDAGHSLKETIGYWLLTLHTFVVKCFKQII